MMKDESRILFKKQKSPQQESSGHHYHLYRAARNIRKKLELDFNISVNQLININKL